MDFAEIRDDDEDAALEQKTGCLKGVLRLLALVLAPLFVCIALLPTLLSTDAGLKWTLAKVNAAAAPLNISVETWSLGWFSAPVLNKVHVADVERGVDITAAQVTSDRGLLRLLPVGVLDAGRVTLKQPSTTVNLVRVPQKPKPEPSGKKTKKGFFFLPIVDVAAALTIEDGRVKVLGHAPETFEAQQVAGTVTLDSYKKPIAVQGQMQVGGGTVALEGRVQSLRDFFKGSELEQPERLTLKLVGVDLAALRPLLQEATGEPWVHSGVAEGVLTAAIKGPDQFSVESAVLITGLSVAAAGQPRSPKGDLALMANVAYNKQSVSVTKFDFSSPWVKAEAGGTLQAGSKAGVMTGAIQAKAEADLAAIARDFAPALGLSKSFKMQKGRLQADFTLEGSEKALRVDATATTTDLAMTIDGEPLVLKPAPSLVFKASFPYGQWPEVETFHLKAPFADVFGSGRFDAAVLKGKLNLTLFSRDFKRILKNAPPMVGSAYLDLATRREDGRVAVSGFLKLSDVAAELSPGQRLVVPQGTVKVEGRVPLKEGRPAGEFQDASFELTLANGKAAGGWKRLTPAQEGQPFVLRGFTLTGDMDLGSVRQLLGGFIPAPAQRRMSAWQGRVIANVTAEAAAGAAKARMNAAARQVVAETDAGIWRVPDIRLESTLSQNTPKDGVRCEVTVTGGGALERDGEVVFAEKAARIAADLTVAADGDRVRVDALTVTSGLLDLNAQAEISELSSRCMTEAKGKLALDFARVTDLLAAEGIDEFELTGHEPREFRLAAPLAGGWATVLSEGEFSGAAFLASLKGLGLKAGGADTSFRLSKGRLKMAYEPTLNSGKLHFVPELSTGNAAGVLSFPPQTRVLDNVALTQEMMDKLLVNLNPLFQGSTVLGGTLTLDVKHCTIAPGVVPEKGVATDMTIVFKQLKLELGPSLRELLGMLKIKDRIYAVEQLPLHVVIRDGRVTVDPVRMVIGKQPVTLGGWVAFDGTIKYLLEVPVTEQWAGSTGAKALKGMTVKIPVTGTIDEPRLDTGSLQSALGGLIQQAVGEQALEKVGTFLEKLQNELKK